MLTLATSTDPFCSKIKGRHQGLDKKGGSNDFGVPFSLDSHSMTCEKRPKKIFGLYSEKKVGLLTNSLIKEKIFYELVEIGFIS